MAKGQKKFKTKNQSSKVVLNVLDHRTPYNCDIKFDFLCGKVGKEHKRSNSSIGHHIGLVDGYVTLNLRQNATSKVFNPQRNDSHFKFSNYNRDFKREEL